MDGQCAGYGGGTLLGGTQPVSRLACRLIHRPREARLMSPIRNGLAALVPIVLGIGHAAAADLPDLTKIDRTIRKEPTYNTKRPLYGLAVFGPKAEARVWIVLDKSKPDVDEYDVVHVDLDADGDLTGPGERLTPDEDGRFRVAHVAHFKDPATGVKHANFNIRITQK